MLLLHHVASASCATSRSPAAAAAAVAALPSNRRTFAAAAATTAADTTRERPFAISVHKGFKVQAALCVERPPLLIQEPEFKKRWRQFKEAWEKSTGNNLKIDDDIVFMRYHFQFLVDPRSARSLAGGGASAQLSAESQANAPSVAASSGDLVSGGDSSPANTSLDKMLAGEGLDLAFPDLGRKTVKKKKVARRVEATVDDADVRALKRLANRTLFLLVRYQGGNKWTFPKADRAHGQPMRDTLEELCEQFGEDFDPYILGACPFAHRKRGSSRDPGIKGRKVFYYRGRVLPGVNGFLSLEEDSNIKDWAWCSRDELPMYLDENEWACVREGLPLDSISL
mmetsp:Transcript_24809/g.53959  ORF Transcript_24809/g.53959 Transcript_24809/m.53959 type:complete len:340 (-) Transcript_24809:51-1070(-)|eukprot:CAMPEP_0206470660 /NCGR_PEP_ID=MMETSP0324_2-20121206/31072_1 /ASSEMBLY_ACC=CAM_ASM_000836 /TAXON_ID=2866 /ORGANISM="Crypthecodinium cohnii, Strain Seligo" /LENGTH=339 /DNA_ID=CAMNT_0053944781 /DNA_START=17 /DNA_END=1036 /DNA_ORIENTATION=-